MNLDIDRARIFAEHAHHNQKYGDCPYYEHLRHTFRVLLRFDIKLEPVLIAAWLHDVIEDCGITKQEIDAEFGAEVARIVDAVSDGPGANRKARQAVTYPKIREAGTPAIVLKLADRIANTEHSISNRSPQLEMYRREFPRFFEALYRPNECDLMWDHLRKITRGNSMKIVQAQHATRRKPIRFGVKRYQKVCRSCGTNFTAKQANRKMCDACSPSVQYRGKGPA